MRHRDPVKVPWTVGLNSVCVEDGGLGGGGGGLLYRNVIYDVHDVAQ